MNTSYDKQLILDFIEWCEEYKNVYLKEMPAWTRDYYSVDEDELVREYLEESD